MAATVSRRGYRFAGPVGEITAWSVALSLTHPKRTNLPESADLVRWPEGEPGEIKQRLPTTRLTTVTGIGGLGKARLAQQVAAEMLDAYRGVWFVDLAPSDLLVSSISSCDPKRTFKESDDRL